MASSRKFGQAIDLSRWLNGDRSRLKSRVTHVGIELEGGWKQNPKPYLVQRDGSVRDIPGYYQIEAGRPGVAPEGYGLMGEIPSPVLNLLEWKDWVKKTYPDDINYTCGMHVHMSFAEALYYSKFMDNRYPATVVEGMRLWAGNVKLDSEHPIWPRVNGESRYCQHVYSAPEQIIATGKDFDQERDGHRYTVIHYPYGRTGTMECRLLPMMATADLAIEAIQEVIDITNAFLLATAKKEKKFSTVFEAESETEPRIRQIFV